MNQPNSNQQTADKENDPGRVVDDLVTCLAHSMAETQDLRYHLMTLTAIVDGMQKVLSLHSIEVPNARMSINGEQIDIDIASFVGRCKALSNVDVESSATAVRVSPNQQEYVQ